MVLYQTFLSKFPRANRQVNFIAREAAWKEFVAMYICYLNMGVVKIAKVVEITDEFDSRGIHMHAKVYDGMHIEGDKVVMKKYFLAICKFYYDLYNFFLNKEHDTTLEKEFTFKDEHKDFKEIVVDIKECIRNSIKILIENPEMSENQEMLSDLKKYNRDVSQGRSLSKTSHDRAISLSEIIMLRAKVIKEEKEKIQEENTKRMGDF